MEVILYFLVKIFEIYCYLKIIRSLIASFSYQPLNASGWTFFSPRVGFLAMVFALFCWILEFLDFMMRFLAGELLALILAGSLTSLAILFSRFFLCSIDFMRDLKCSHSWYSGSSYSTLSKIGGKKFMVDAKIVFVAFAEFGFGEGWYPAWGREVHRFRNVEA